MIPRDEQINSDLASGTRGPYSDKVLLLNKLLNELIYELLWFKARKINELHHYIAFTQLKELLEKFDSIQLDIYINELNAKINSTNNNPDKSSMAILQKMIELKALLDEYYNQLQIMHRALYELRLELKNDYLHLDQLESQISENYSRIKPVIRELYSTLSQAIKVTDISATKFPESPILDNISISMKDLEHRLIHKMQEAFTSQTFQHLDIGVEERKIIRQYLSDRVKENTFGQVDEAKLFNETINSAHFESLVNELCNLVRHFGESRTQRHELKELHEKNNKCKMKIAEIQQNITEKEAKARHIEADILDHSAKISNLILSNNSLLSEHSRTSTSHLIAKLGVATANPNTETSTRTKTLDDSTTYPKIDIPEVNLNSANKNSDEDAIFGNDKRPSRKI